MAVRRPPQSPALHVVRGSRGVPETVTLRRTDALAPCLEGIAACDEAIAAAERIVMAAMADAPMAVVGQAQRMAVRLIGSRNELRRMAGLVEPRDGSAA